MVGKCEGRPALAAVDTHHKVSVVELKEEAYRLVMGERGVAVITGNGYYELNPDSEVLKPEKLYSELTFHDVLFMENGCQVLVGLHEAHLISTDGDHVGSFDYHSMIGAGVQCDKAVKVGRNVLLSVKNSFVLAHLEIRRDNTAIELS